MPQLPEGCQLFLDPQDDYNHAPDACSNYNESMDFSVVDPVQKTGGWDRLGNRVNEGLRGDVELLVPPRRPRCVHGPWAEDHDQRSDGRRRAALRERRADASAQDRLRR